MPSATGSVPGNVPPATRQHALPRWASRKYRVNTRLKRGTLALPTSLVVLSNGPVTICPDQSRHLPHHLRSRTEAVVRDRGRA